MNDPPYDAPATSSHDVEYVDSAATTLLASPVSFEGKTTARESLDGELKRHRQYNLQEHELADESFQGVEDDAKEYERLLSQDTATLNDDAVAAQTAMVDDQEPAIQTSANTKEDKPVTWSSLPKKRQLAILTLARLSEPLAQTSLQAYIFYQLKTFHVPGTPPPSDATVATQAGILAAAFTGAQMCTAVMWGRLADSEAMGRKRVLLIGILGTAIGSLGFGFSSSFGQAVAWRAMGGALNGNVGVMRTMISEIVVEKRFQSRAFLLMPMTFNIGVIVGPLLGGLLADPVGSYPALFGEHGGGWLRAWPYALPSVVCAGFLTCGAVALVLGLEETLEGLRGRPDYGIRFSRWVVTMIGSRRTTGEEYQAVATQDSLVEDIEMSASSHERKPSNTRRQKLPFRRIWTTNLILTLMSHAFLAGHVGTFNSLWFVFLSTPRYTPNSTNNDNDSKTLHLPSNYHPHGLFTFTGGLALPPPSIGTALAILGVIGISLQLVFYPAISFRLGTILSYRYSLLLFPFSYFLAPYLAIVPSSSAAPAPASGPWIWISITLLLLIQVTARTFALPGTAILVNNSCPHPSVLGTVHGIAQTVSSAARTVGPVLVGWGYGKGLEAGVVGSAWWGMAGLAVVGAIVGRWVKEGSGHEVLLEGEEGEDGKG
ncbi:hypothetical protein LTR62_008311 [Meristemomyces frigidus]|uniref:Major facilitator superfamily (MFS) profile domain-containing protein n=1 Tax=Meristemomyces frigidus TaxID=1508187 RepID=A0AAN7TA17_9PEZI|nr:hypothetical protein LTR62_008311 [Meristemomyces frigidus]